MCAGTEGSPTWWIYVKDGHYQSVVLRRDVVLMHLQADSTPDRTAKQCDGEYFFLLPTGVIEYRLRLHTKLMKEYSLM